MFQDKPEWIAHQRQRWLRPDAERWLRPDAHRWMTPQAQRWLLPERKRAVAQPPSESDRLGCARRSARATPPSARRASLTQSELKFRQFLRSLKAGYRPDQLRDDLGRWTDEGGGGRTQLAASGRPPVGPAAALVLALELALNVIKALSVREWPLGFVRAAVRHCCIDDSRRQNDLGSNSKSPTYSDVDFREAETLRTDLAEKYPDLFSGENLGQRAGSVSCGDNGLAARSTRQRRYPSWPRD